jgi:glutathione S-transferase
MKLILVSYALCPFVHRSTTLLHEKEVEFELRYIDLSNKPDWFLAISPRGKVPVLQADGIPIFESAVINEFLDETHAPRLLPHDPFERARQRGWQVVADDLFLAHYKLTYDARAEEFTKAQRTVASILGRFEESLREPFFAGAAFGLVDAAIAPILYRLVLLDAHSSLGIFAAFPRVNAWAQRVAARPSVIAGVLPDFDQRYLDANRKRSSHLASLLTPG